MRRAYELYLVRHGVAEERGPDWSDDAKRPLTPDGISRLRQIGRGLRQLDVAFDVVLTSPLERARQTADILAGAIGPDCPVELVQALAPGGSPAGVMNELGSYARKSRIALVGHEPGIGELTARLLGARHAIEFKKGAVCRVDVDALPPTGPGMLRWYLPPKVLRAINRR